MSMRVIFAIPWATSHNKSAKSLCSVRISQDRHSRQSCVNVNQRVYLKHSIVMITAFQAVIGREGLTDGDRLLSTEISTELCYWWKNRCANHWIFQQSIMIERCFNFLTVMPWNNESFCGIQISSDCLLLSHNQCNIRLVKGGSEVMWISYRLKKGFCGESPGQILKDFTCMIK